MMNIVIALDRSRHARAAIQLLQQLRWPAGSTLTLLHVLEIVTIPGGWQLHYHPELWKQFEADRRKVFEQAERFLERLGTQLRQGDARPEVVVKFSDAITPAERQAVYDFIPSHGAQVAEDFSEWEMIVVKVKPSELKSMINALAALAGVQFAYPNPIMVPQLDASPKGWCSEPNTKCDDWTRFTGTQRAWDYTTGSPDVSVLVIDIDIGNNAYEKRDIKPVPVRGLEPFKTDLQVLQYGTSYHGAQVATILSAPGNDGTGSAGPLWGGTLWGANLVSFRCSENNPNCISYSQFADVFSRAIKQVNKKGLIINISLGTQEIQGGGAYEYFDILEPGIREAYVYDALIVLAAGNAGIVVDKPPFTPPSDPSNPDPNNYVLIVGGIDTTVDGGAVYGNRGAAVPITAPAKNIGTSLGIFGGTSAAAPQVAGAAALVKSLNPSMTAPEIRARLLSSACPVAGTNMLNIWRALDPSVSIEVACSNPNGPNLLTVVYEPQAFYRETLSGTVSTDRRPQGMITSSPEGIFCGDFNSIEIPFINCGFDPEHPPIPNSSTNSTVTLVAQAQPGSLFRGWTGPCVGTGPCTVNIDREVTVGAYFSLDLAADGLSVTSSSCAFSHDGIDPLNKLSTKYFQLTVGGTVSSNTSGENSSFILGGIGDGKTASNCGGWSVYSPFGNPVGCYRANDSQPVITEWSASTISGVDSSMFVYPYPFYNYSPITRIFSTSVGANRRFPSNILFSSEMSDFFLANCTVP